MTLQDFLKLNLNTNYLLISLYNDNHYIDCYYKNELKDSIYLNKEVTAFQVGNETLEIEIEE